MNVFKRNIEAKKARNTLSVNELPVDEEIFCSALSNGRARSFDRLNDEEVSGLKKFLNGLSHELILEGIYSIANEVKIISENEISVANDQKIIDYLRSFEVINAKNQFQLKNAKGDLITFSTPLKKHSVFALSMFANLLGQVYLKRSSIVN